MIKEQMGKKKKSKKGNGTFILNFQTLLTSKMGGQGRALRQIMS